MQALSVSPDGDRGILLRSWALKAYELPEGYYERLHKILQKVLEDFTEDGIKTRSVWLATAIACGLPATGAVLAIQMNPQPEAKRSPMSQPAWQIPAKVVAISVKGKTFHITSCPRLHGEWHLVKAV